MNNSKGTTLPLYRSPDGRLWWIDEDHPYTTGEWCICRMWEDGNGLAHSAVWARKDLKAVLDAEQDAYDSMPEGIQAGERGEQAQSAISSIENAISSLESAVSDLSDAQGE